MLSNDCKTDTQTTRQSSSAVSSETGDKSEATSQDIEANDGITGGTVGEKKGRQKRGGKALVKTKKKDDVERYVKLARSNRGKKKYVTGLQSFNFNQLIAQHFVLINMRKVSNL